MQKSTEKVSNIPPTNSLAQKHIFFWFWDKKEKEIFLDLSPKSNPEKARERLP